MAVKDLALEEQETIALARSLIRDMAHGWPPKELAEDPRRVCERLSELLGEGYDFDDGEVVK